MPRNILLTSLSAADNNLPLRYFSIRNEFGFDYCDALLDAEASIKAMLARFKIDEIYVICGARAYDERDDLKPASLRDGNALYSADKASLSTYGLLKYRLAQYAEELALDQEAADGRLTGEAREKLIRFVRDFQERDEGLKNRRLNRLFDAIAQDGRIYERFWTALSEACPELRDNPEPTEEWMENYLFAEMKPTLKLELLPVNEEARIHLIPWDQMEGSGQWVDGMMTMEQSIVTDQDDINLYVSLNSDDAADTFIVMNMLDILVAMPGSRVRLKKIFTVRSAQRSLTGILRDDTDGFGVTELFHAIRSFLNYGKADMIADIFEKSGERNESIAGMVYAMRHVDAGLSMCSMREVEDGILRLRELFRSGKLWRECGYYGMLFSVIAESIREDYGVLLEGDGEISFIDLVKWAYRHHFYQQTLTLIESKAPGNLVKYGIFYYCGDEENAEQVTRLFAEQRLELKPYEYYKMDYIDHYFIKTYARSRTRGLGARGEDTQHVYAVLRTQSVENKDPAYVTGLTACDSMETLQNLLYAYYHIGDVRNKINHAEVDAVNLGRLSVSESDESAALSWVRDGIDFFIESYDKAMAEVQDKKPHVVSISGEDVRKAAEHMKNGMKNDIRNERY